MASRICPGFYSELVNKHIADRQKRLLTDETELDKDKMDNDSDGKTKKVYKCFKCDEENSANDCTKIGKGEKVESRRLTDEEFVLLINAPLVQTALELGFTKEKVKEALMCKFHESGLPFHTTDDLIDTILVHESDDETCNEHEN
jgi:hypothetical protein